MGSMTGEWGLFGIDDLQSLTAQKGDHHWIGGELEQHIRELSFHHFKESKLPRAHKLRPYKMVLENEIAAGVLLRTSEAYGLCEIADLRTRPDFKPVAEQLVENTLIFAMCDAIKNGLLPSLGFADTAMLGPDFVLVQAVLASRLGGQVSASTPRLSPTDGERLLIALTGAHNRLAQAIDDYVAANHFSRARIGYLIGAGIWSLAEITYIFAHCSHPDVILGYRDRPLGRLLGEAEAFNARGAILATLFHRACTVHLANDAQAGLTSYLVESNLSVDDHLGFRMSAPAPSLLSSGLPGWEVCGDPSPSAWASLVATDTEIQDLNLLVLALDEGDLCFSGVHCMSRLSRKDGMANVVLVPSDLHEVDPVTTSDLTSTARSRGFKIVVAPVGVSELEAELDRRQRMMQGVMK